MNLSGMRNTTNAGLELMKEKQVIVNAIHQSLFKIVPFLHLCQEYKEQRNVPNEGDSSWWLRKRKECGQLVNLLQG